MIIFPAKSIQPSWTIHFSSRECEILSVDIPNDTQVRFTLRVVESNNKGELVVDNNRMFEVLNQGEFSCR